MTSQRDRVAAFRDLHEPGRPLVLANAWDGASARVFELTGFSAIGTTSAGVAWSLGYPDGERLPLTLLLGAVERIVASVRIPVTVDIVRGYGATPAEVAEVVRALVERGAVGVNIEDGGADASVLAEKIAAIRALPIFINARTDLYLQATEEADARFAEAVRRLEIYAAAGADGLFVPGLAEREEIARMVPAVHRPLNIYAGSGVPDVPELARLGVARVSVGCGPMQATLGLARQIGRALLAEGTYGPFTDRALPYAEVNQMFT